VLNAECWTQTKDIHGFGGDEHNITTVGECQRACINNITCVAIDWEPSNAGKTCWILTGTVTRETQHPGDITHYELNRTCLGKSRPYYTIMCYAVTHWTRFCLVVELQNNNCGAERKA